MAELKPAVNTNVLLPVSVSVRHLPSLSILSLSLSLFSPRSLSLTSSEGPEAARAAAQEHVISAPESERTHRLTQHCLSELNWKRTVDLPNSERLHCEGCTVAPVGVKHLSPLGGDTEQVPSNPDMVTATR